MLTDLDAPDQFIVLEADELLINYQGQLQQVRLEDYPEPQPVGQSGKMQAMRMSRAKDIEIALNDSGEMLLYDNHGYFYVPSLERQTERVELPRPEIFSKAVKSTFHGPHDNMGFLTGGPVLMLQMQMLVAYDRQGSIRWTFMTGGAADFLTQPDGDRLLLLSGDGNAYCISDAGEELWRRSGSFQAAVSSAGPVLADEASGSMLSLDWNGNEIFRLERGLDSPSPPVVLANPLRDEAFFLSGGKLSCHSADGTPLWEMPLEDAVSASVSMSRDGYIFLMQYPERRRNPGRFLGRIPGGYSARGKLDCFDVLGSHLWQFSNDQAGLNTSYPGEHGRLFAIRGDRLICIGLEEASGERGKAESSQ
ncbi:PQQ-binding-like beta-propeller repeat protein [bacterium]|nr:PQQ-binding-like beta-propeller repeat protein [bacterium]